MRISNILSTLLFISAATAATIRYPLSPKKIDTTVSKRVTWSHIQGINIWSTARAGSGAVQLTILGGLRLTPVLRDVFGETNYGPTLANAFYLDIMSKIEALHIANIIPVYKDANAPDWGILGLRVDVSAEGILWSIVAD
jgi:hypothetical protein